MDTRTWILRSLALQGAGLLAALLCGLLATVLWLAGDLAGAGALRGLTLVGGVVFAISHLGLIGLLAFRELQRSTARPESGP